MNYDETFCTISDSKYNTQTSSKPPCFGSGDSGGPLACYEQDKNNNYNAYINGVVSRSADNCEKVDIWTDVRKLREWIDPLLVSSGVQFMKRRWKINLL